MSVAIRFLETFPLNFFSKAGPDEITSLFEYHDSLPFLPLDVLPLVLFLFQDIYHPARGPFLRDV